MERAGEKAVDSVGPHSPIYEGKKNTLAFLSPSVSLGDAQAEYPLSSHPEIVPLGSIKGRDPHFVDEETGLWLP